MYIKLYKFFFGGYTVELTIEELQPKNCFKTVNAFFSVLQKWDLYGICTNGFNYDRRFSAHDRYNDNIVRNV